MNQKLKVALGCMAVMQTGAMALPAAASVTCPGPPPVAYFVTAGPKFNPSASLGPGLAGCNPATFISLAGGQLWNWTGASAAAGGDKVSWAGSWINGFGYGTVTLDPGLPAVTPTSPLASISLAVSAVGPASGGVGPVTYTVTWSGTDPGTGQILRWYDYGGSSTGFSGPGTDNTDLPGWSSLSTLLEEIDRIGPWSETLMRTFTVAAGHEIILAVNGVAASIVPEPGTLALLAGGFFLIAALQRRRRT